MLEFGGRSRSLTFVLFSFSVAPMVRRALPFVLFYKNTKNVNVTHKYIHFHFFSRSPLKMESPRRGSRASGPASAPPRTASQFFPETPGFAFDLARQGNNMDEEEEVRMNVHANINSTL